jgi:hypothetical protein
MIFRFWKFSSTAWFVILTHSKNVVKSERYRVIHSCQIFRKPIQNVADEIGVEKSHRCVDNRRDHVFVELHRCASAKQQQSNNSAQRRDCCSNRHKTVHVKHFGSLLLQFFIFRRIGCICDCIIEDLFFQIHPEIVNRDFCRLVVEIPTSRLLICPCSSSQPAPLRICKRLRRTRRTHHRILCTFCKQLSQPRPISSPRGTLSSPWWSP